MLWKPLPQRTGRFITTGFVYRVDNRAYARWVKNGLDVANGFSYVMC